MIQHLLTFALTVFTGLIAMINPVANIPAFLGLVGDNNNLKQKALAQKACITAFIILASFVILGKFIFLVFGLTVPAFKITGGILIFKIGFDMLQSKALATKKTVGEVPEDDSVAICPLAIPLLAGPGAIVTSMDFVSDTGLPHFIIVVLIVGLVIYINYLAFRSGELIVRKLGHNVINVLNKLMGLILAIMGTGMVIAGFQMLKI